MRLMLTALVFLMGLFMLLLAGQFLLEPGSAAESVLGIPGITAANPHAMSSMRGDVQAFFAIVGICMLWGAWKRSGDLLLVPAIMMVLVIFGRVVGAMHEGTYDSFNTAVGAEAIITAVLLWARSVLPHHALKDVGD